MHANHALRTRIPFAVVVSLALWLAWMPAAHSATKFWTGTSSGNFNVAGNWTPSGAPAAGDDLVFQTGVTRLLVTNDFSPNRAFSTVTFQGSNYFVRGNALLLTNGISAINPVGRNTIDADVDVRASQPWEATGLLGILDVNGNINLNANLLTVRANTGDFFFSGVISGTGGINKTNVGTLRMDGLAANTYTGTTIFGGGVLELAKTNTTAIPGDLIVGDGNGLLATDVLRLLSDEQIADASDVTIKNSGLFDGNGFDEHIGALTMQGGTLNTEGGTFYLGGNLTTLTDNNTAFIEGRLSLGVASRTFTVNSGPPGADLQINAVIRADPINPFTAVGFTKIGGGSLFLAGTNTYNGTTVINEGQLAVLSDRALGATANPLGSAPTVVNANGNLFLSGVQVTNEVLTINSFNPGGAFNASGASVWTGDILLNIDTFIASSGSLLLNGAITGVGGFTKLSTGSLTLGGTNANTYSGTTTVRDGTLFLDKDTLFVLDGAMSGPLVVGENELPENTDIVRWLRCCQLPDDTEITINSSGLLDLNGFGENVGDLVFNGGDITTGAGSILPIGNITVNSNNNSQAIISGRMSVLSNPIIDVTGHFFSPDLNITAVLFGSGGFTKNGVGEVGLTASNSYSGLTTVNDGFLIVDNSFALGTTSSGTIVNTGAVLALRFDAQVPAEALTLAGTGQSAFGALSSSFGSNSWAGNITLGADAHVTVDSGDFLNLSGGIGGAHNLTKQGTGTLLFTGGSGTGNTYNDTFLNAGTLVLQKTIANVSIPGDLTLGDGSGGVNADVVRLNLDNQISDSTAIHIASSGLLDLNDRSDTTGSIDGSSTTSRIDMGSGTFRVGNDNGTTNYNGLILGAGSLFKFGTGNWTLNGNNTYSGQTTVSAGTLTVNGLQPQSPVTVNGTANLAGSGTVGNLNVFGNLRPGSSPGMLTSSNVAFSSAADYFVELNGPNPGPGYDQLNVRGTNNLGSSTLHVSVGGGFAPFEGEEFIILNNDGAEAIVGTFNGLANNSVFTANGLQFRIRYADAFGNDVVLTVTNTAARLASTAISSGNGNGAVDVNECNLLNVVITNVSGATVSGVTGTLVPKTPGVSVTAGSSAYPNMAANGRGTNATPFQFSTGPGFICGTNVDFDLVVQTATNGTFSIPISLTSGSTGAVLRFNNNTVTAIPDAGFVDSSLVVSGVTTPIKRVTVLLHLTHTADSDLDISLIAPDGTTIDLSSDNGGTLDDYGTDCTDANRTTFSDAGGALISSATAPFVGTFRPEQALSAFNEKSGAAVNGTWRLRVADDTAGGVGSLRCWSLLIAPTTCADGGGACESCPGNVTLAGTLGAGSLVQTGRLNRNGTASSCAVSKTCPGSVGSAAINYDAYTFENGESNACITVTLASDCDVFSGAYLNSYNPASLCQNYLADAGTSTGGGTNQYSFNVPARARFVLVVNEVNTGGGCGYTLNVGGGSCRPSLNITALTNNQVRLDWTTAALGYGLESTNLVIGPGHPLWVPVPTVPVITGSRFTVTNTPASPRFFQLRKP